MLIDWNGPLQTDRTFSLKKGSKWCVVYQEYDRVTMTNTQSIIQPSGHFLGFFVSLTCKTGGPFGGAVLPYAEDTVSIFYSLM